MTSLQPALIPSSHHTSPSATIPPSKMELQAFSRRPPKGGVVFSEGGEKIRMATLVGSNPIKGYDDPHSTPTLHLLSDKST
jgi:hypothetical protein